MNTSDPLAQFGLVQISPATAYDYFPANYLEKYEIGEKEDDIYIPITWTTQAHHSHHLHKGKSVLHKDAAKDAEKIIRSTKLDLLIASDGCNWKYAIKPPKQKRGQKLVFKWGIARDRSTVPYIRCYDAFKRFYKLPYVALCSIRYFPSKQTYSIMVFMKDGSMY